MTRVLFAHCVIRPEVVKAIAEQAPDAEMMNTSGDPWEYWRQLSARWDKGEDLIIIEHDILIGPGFIDSLAGCPEAWCTYEVRLFPAPGDVLCTWSMGCVKFSQKAQQIVPLKSMRQPWSVMDGHIACCLVENGIRPHVHGEVTHLHPYDADDPMLAAFTASKQLNGEYLPLPGTPEADKAAEAGGSMVVHQDGPASAPSAI